MSLPSQKTLSLIEAVALVASRCDVTLVEAQAELIRAFRHRELFAHPVDRSRGGLFGHTVDVRGAAGDARAVIDRDGTPREVYVDATALDKWLVSDGAELVATPAKKPGPPPTEMNRLLKEMRLRKPEELDINTAALTALFQGSHAYVLKARKKVWYESSYSPRLKNSNRNRNQL